MQSEQGGACIQPESDAVHSISYSPPRHTSGRTILLVKSPLHTSELQWHVACDIRSVSLSKQTNNGVFSSYLFDATSITHLSAPVNIITDLMMKLCT